MCRGVMGGIFFSFFLSTGGFDNYGLNDCSESASLNVCKKRKAQLKPLQGRLITPRKRGNINGSFCGDDVAVQTATATSAHVKWGPPLLLKAHMCACVCSTCEDAEYVCVSECARVCPNM